MPRSADLSRSDERRASLARTILLCCVAASQTFCGPGSQPAQEAAASDPGRGVAVGDARAFVSRYLAFRDRQLASANPDTLTIQLGFVKGISRSFSGTAGTVSVDLRSGSFEVSLHGLTPGETYAVRLVDQHDDGTERTLTLATVPAQGASASASGRLDPGEAAGLAADRAVVTRGDSAEVVASGSIGVLQKIFFRRQRLSVEPSGALSVEDPSEAPPLATVVAAVEVEAAEGDALTVPVDPLVDGGARLFSTATFGGNGRTCATCHPPGNNFTIGPAFIAGLPPNDPLFVAELVPELAGLERPALLRQFGLIVENLDGMEDPANKLVMRSVPHTIGLPVSLQQDTSLADAPAQMTGWAGDGAPGAGSLRDFAVGAITQHFTKTLERVPGRDFVLPSESQLDQLEAFQLSIGRDADPDLSRMSFLDPAVEAGKSIFLDGTGDPEAGGTCNACHANGGALNSAGQNRNFNTNVEERTHPAEAVEPYPPDGGFGQGPANPDGSFGDGEFNTPSVIEAADTPPFFHNNLVSTLEDVVRFYAGPEFNAPRDAGGRFRFDETQVTRLAQFMRAINVVQNIDVARRALTAVLALPGNLAPQVQPRLQAALADTGDALRVLAEGSLFPAASQELEQARQRVTQAQQVGNPDELRDLVQQAIGRLDAARGAVVAAP